MGEESKAQSVYMFEQSDVSNHRQKAALRPQPPLRENRSGDAAEGVMEAGVQEQDPREGQQAWMWKPEHAQAGEGWRAAVGGDVRPSHHWPEASISQSLSH